MTLPVPITKVAGAPRCHEESKTLLVRQIRPSYCATRTLPLATCGPVPWIRVLACSVPGGAAFGIVTCGAAPADGALTVGGFGAPRRRGRPPGPRRLRRPAS